MDIELRNHQVYRAYIALARSENYQPKVWTRADAVHDVADLDVQRVYCELERFDDEKISGEIEKHRGLSADLQFELGIVTVPRKLANELICEKLVNVFGLETVSNTPGFNEKGRLRIEKRADFIFPVRAGKLITKLTFYTLHEMRQWSIKAA